MKKKTLSAPKLTTATAPCPSQLTLLVGPGSCQAASRSSGQSLLNLDLDWLSPQREHCVAYTFGIVRVNLLSQIICSPSEPFCHLPKGKGQRAIPPVVETHPSERARGCCVQEPWKAAIVSRTHCGQRSTLLCFRAGTQRPTAGAPSSTPHHAVRVKKSPICTTPELRRDDLEQSMTAITKSGRSIYSKSSIYLNPCQFEQENAGGRAKNQPHQTDACP